MIMSGKDLFGRDLEFEVIQPQNGLPAYLTDNEVQQKFAPYLLNPLK